MSTGICPRFCRHPTQSRLSYAGLGAGPIPIDPGL